MAVVDRHLFKRLSLAPKILVDAGSGKRPTRSSMDAEASHPGAERAPNEALNFEV